MATYRFEENFKVDIINPIITADVDTLSVKPTQMTIDVDIKLETENAKVYGYRLKDISVNNLSFEGYDNLMLRVMEKLQEYAI
jgi:hypothetical protein